MLSHNRELMWPQITVTSFHPIFWPTFDCADSEWIIFIGYFSGQVEQSLRCAGVSLCIRTITFELNDLWPRYLASWFVSWPRRSYSKAKVIGHSSRSQKENVAKLVCSTSSEGFLVSVVYVQHSQIFQHHAHILHLSLIYAGALRLPDRVE